MLMAVFYYLIITGALLGITMVIGPLLLLPHIIDKKDSDINFSIYFFNNIKYTDYGYRIYRNLRVSALVLFILQVRGIVFFFFIR